MPNEVVKQENPNDILMEIIESGPGILLYNQDLLEKTKTSVEELLVEIERDGMDDDLDIFCNKIQIRIKEVYEEMNAGRTPLTKQMDQIKSSFTALEAVVDPKNANSLFGRIGAKRNEYATKKAEEQRRRDEEARLRLQKEQERNRLIGEADIQIRNGFLTYLTNYKQRLQDIVNRMTLADYDSVWDDVHNWPTVYSLDAFDTIGITLRGVYLQPDEIMDIKLNARQGKYEIWKKEFQTEIDNQKRDFLDKLPGMKKYLEEKKRLEDEQRRKDEEARKQREEAQKIEDEKERERQLEAVRLQEIENERIRQENLRIEEDRKKKEEDERIRLQEEQRLKELENESKVEMETNIRNSNTLFENELQVQNPDSSKPIESYEITVKSSVGLLHIVSHYFTYKGNQEDVETNLKLSLNQMKTFCEKDFKKTGRKIDSPLVEYKPVYKMQARK